MSDDLQEARSRALREGATPEALLQSVIAGLIEAQRQMNESSSVAFNQEDIDVVIGDLQLVLEKLAVRRCSRCGHVGHNARTCGPWVETLHTCTPDCRPKEVT